MPLHIIRQDITTMCCDAIVNPTDAFFSGSGGTDAQIHAAAGELLRRECHSLGGCAVGEAAITGAYDLPSKYIIHTVGPVWQGGNAGEEELLIACYKNCMRLASEAKCTSVALPLISTGTYGYPKDKAFRCAMDVISGFLLETDMTVYLLVYDKEALSVSERLFANVISYIDDNYISQKAFAVPPAQERRRSAFKGERRRASAEEEMCCSMPIQPSFAYGSQEACSVPMPQEVSDKSTAKLEDALSRIDESFSQMLLRHIDKKGMTDAECYKKANIDRKLFSKIRSDVNYRPKKTTALAFAIALELDIEETADLLRRAGFALSHSNKFDIIIEFFIKNGNYNIFEINETLFAFDQNLLGA